MTGTHTLYSHPAFNLSVYTSHAHLFIYEGDPQSVDLNAMYQDEIPSVDHMLPTRQMTGKILLKQINSKYLTRRKKKV